MIESLYISATGMHAQQTQLDVIANNMANMNTMGFKKSRVAFETLMPHAAAASDPELQGVGATTSYQGGGVAGANVLLDFVAGALKQTQNEDDLAIQGGGFFEVQMADGSFAYTRNGTFHRNVDGYLVSADGFPLSAQIQLPADAEQMVVEPDGRVRVKYKGSSELAEVGDIELSHFMNEGGLRPLGKNLYQATEASGEVIYRRPGEDGSGTLSQGYLEGSNVQMVEELTNLMIAQRAYEANSKVLQASDEVLGIINNLRRS